MGHLKKITRVIVNVLTCLLFLILILVIYGKLITTFGENQYPNYFGYTFFEVASGSMEPALKVNDVVLVKITKENLQERDIIAFKVDDVVITHRILFVDGDIITVKGDHNDVVDKPITKAQVIGKIIKIFPELGVWKKVLTDPKILFGIFVTLLLFDFALSYGNKENKKIEKMLDLDEGKLVATPVPKESIKIENKEESKKEKVIESEKLLELTRKIDIDEINKLLEGTDYKLAKREISNIKQEINKIEKSIETNEKVIPKFNDNEKKVLEYTLRLDLDRIQKKISDKIK